MSDKKCFHWLKKTTRINRINKKLLSKGYKICIVCNKKLPVSEYYPNKIYGLRFECKECIMVQRKGAEHRTAYLESEKRKKELLSNGMYECTNCKKVKPLSAFYIRNGKPRSMCIECCNKKIQEAYFKNHKEQLEKSRLKYCKRREYHKKWSREYLKTPKGRASKIKAEHTRRAKLMNVPSEDYSDWIRKIKEAGLFKCFYCGLMFTSDKLTIDHKKPISKDGSDTRDNVVQSCLECNQTKASREDVSAIDFWSNVSLDI